MNSGSAQDVESLTGGESISTLSSQHVLLQDSRHNKMKKLLVTITLLLLVGLVAAAVGCGIVFTEDPELIESNNHLRETSDEDFSNDHVAVFKELRHSDTHDSSVETLPKPLPQTATNVNDNQVTVLQSNRTVPGDAATRHPVSLLYEMRRSPTFETHNCPKQHQYFKTVVTIGRETFEGYGKNKRAAKKLAAQFACAALFRLTYSDLPTSIQSMAEKCGI